MGEGQMGAAVYVAILGVATLAFGITDILVSAAGAEVVIGPIAIPNDLFRGVWGGIVVACAGGLMISSIRDIGSIQEYSKALLGAMLIWLMAGCDLFWRLCSSIPASPESPEFFNSLDGFLAGFALPYPPAVFLLPLTIVIALLMVRWKFEP
jgi:hypothetical protein